MSSLDDLPILAILLICVLGQILFIEAGYRFGSRKNSKPNKSQQAQVRSIMGASLGLLAFMLAFSFNTVSPFE